MIVSFGDDTTEDIFHGRNTKRARKFPSDLHEIAGRKLDAIDAASILEDLRVPPGNRLEKLNGDLDGYHSIRINDQWRIVFKWDHGAASEVKISDYH